MRPLNESMNENEETVPCSSGEIRFGLQEPQTGSGEADTSTSSAKKTQSFGHHVDYRLGRCREDVLGRGVGRGGGGVELSGTPGAYRLRYELPVARVGPGKNAVQKTIGMEQGIITRARCESKCRCRPETTVRLD